MTDRISRSEAVAALRAFVAAEVRDRTTLLDRRLADLRRTALAVYHGRVGFENPHDPDILALGAALFPDRARAERPKADQPDCSKCGHASVLHNGPRLMCAAVFRGAFGPCTCPGYAALAAPSASAAQAVAGEGHVHESVRHTHNGTTHDHALGAEPAQPAPPMAGEVLVAWRVATGDDQLPAGWTVVSGQPTPSAAGLDEYLMTVIKAADHFHLTGDLSRLRIALNL